jgi:signal transduction histidine kinase
VWANLISNAIYAMKGSGTLTIEIATEAPYVRVRIIDTGPGIPPEIVNRIFEPFFTTKEAGEGNGLGLDICRRIVERHRGRITVESKPGNTCFSVYLPLEQN